MSVRLMKEKMLNVLVVRWLLLVCVVAGCVGPLEPGRLPTDEERCAFQGGSFRGGICHTRGGQ